MIANTEKHRPKPVVLVILDGFGVAPPSKGNAITLAKMPTWNSIITRYPTMTLHASGEEVGLAWGEMGGSEVGHLNIGSGRVFYQDMMRITHEIRTGAFFKNQVLKDVCMYVKRKKSKLHIIGLLSNAGVHSFDEHLYALVEFAKIEKVKDVYLHLILDGRDTPYNSAKLLIKELQEKLEKYRTGKIASLSGRFYAMDRDNNWERTQKAYEAMIGNVGEKSFENSKDALEYYYNRGIYDEEFPPTVIVDKKGEPVGPVQDNDGVVFFNFRADRARQLTKAFVLPGFVKFDRQYMRHLFFVTMTEYDPDLPVKVAFRKNKIKNSLAEVISNNGLKQLHIAETEKYAHVTYFFNGGVEEPFKGQKNILIPSLGVKNYAKKPEMSAFEITRVVINSIRKDLYDFIVVNYANSDMVAHTGDLNATIRALEYIDDCLKQLIDVILEMDGVCIITADHGNAESLIKIQTESIDKEHSTSPVPFVLVSNEWEGKTAGFPEVPGGDLSLIRPQGMLSDIAPTVLKIMGLKQPKEMSGQSLI